MPYFVFAKGFIFWWKVMHFSASFQLVWLWADPEHSSSACENIMKCSLWNEHYNHPEQGYIEVSSNWGKKNNAFLPVSYLFSRIVWDYYFFNLILVWGRQWSYPHVLYVCHTPPPTLSKLSVFKTLLNLTGITQQPRLFTG